MEDLACSGGDGDIPPEEKAADKKPDVEDWVSNLLKSLVVAYRTNIETKELLYGNQSQCKELPVSAVKVLKAERFALKDLSAPVGHTLNLLVIKQYPSQQNTEGPLFELEEFADHYKVLDVEMAKVYSRSYTRPRLDLKQTPVGTCAVFRTWPNRADDSEDFVVYGHEGEKLDPNVKRIRIVGLVDEDGQAYSVEFIDDNTLSILDSRSEVFPMDKFCAVLPPKICEIELEGLTYYKDVELIRRFLRYDNDEYVFDGAPVTAEVQASGQVLIWNHNFPKEKFPYGINGFILKSIWEAISYRPQLPPEGCEMKEGYIVSSDAVGNIWLQFASPSSTHFDDVLAGVPQELLENLKGSVKLPERGVIYLAPHHRSDGSHYRAEIISPVADLKKMESPEDEVEVSFIDYGDTAIVQVKTLVKAEDAHVLLPLFPRLCVKVHLDNIRAFKHEEYLREFQSDLESHYGVFIVKAKTASEPAEVILKHYLDEDDDVDDDVDIDDVVDEEKYWLFNVEAVRRNVAAHVNPAYDYAKAMRDVTRVRPPNTLRHAMPPYLGLGQVATGRLQIGTEVDALIMWHKRMPRGWFFMRAMHRYHFFKEMEMELSDLQRKMLAEKKMKFNKVQPNDRHQGIAVLVASKMVVRFFARGILLEKCRRKEKGANGKVEEAKDEKKGETDSEANEENIYWKVYLQDYGIVENVNVRNILKIPLKYLQIPAFGILAKHENFVKDEDVKDWWRRLHRSSHKSKKSPPEEKFDRYDENQSEQRIVKILKLSTNWPYGETAVVDFASKRN